MAALSAVHGGQEANATVLVAGESAVTPFRSSAAELVELFETLEAGKPQWHCGRAAALGREAIVQPIAAVSDAYRRLAARHLATARLLQARRADGS